MDSPANAIAIVGMAGRFPGANSPDELWSLVRDGREAVRRMTDAELRTAGVTADMLSLPNYVKSAATLDAMDQFDAGFFNFSPRDAAIMDPQHRHFLECAWEALEHAGYVPDSFPGSIGVFGGCGMQGYFSFNLLNNPSLMRSTGLFLVRHTGNDKDFLSTRVSYQLNLRGPSISVQTACSTSLVAMHLACQSLLNGECDMALAGGVTIEIPHGRGYVYEEGEILSPDGHCRPFDAASKGTVFGSGAGIVVLRRLEDALAAGDHIEAIIRGSAVNNDGAGKVGYLAPSVDGQAAVVAEALAIADVEADSITYIETHGTGTPVGDPIEVAALTEAFQRQTTRTGYCGIGSIKSNIGHLDTAAGVASLIKVVQSLKHRQLAPSLHFESPNPLIDFPNTPFYVNRTLKPWTVASGPRRAGVTSLGVGGTNAHIILEEAPPVAVTPADRPQLLVLSARTPSALDAATARLAQHFDSHPEADLASAAWTLQTGRKVFDHRRVMVARDAADAADVLRNPSGSGKRVFTGRKPESPASLVFLFPGGGAQYPNMGLEIYQREPLFREIVDQGLAVLRSKHGIDLRPLMFPAPGAESAAARELEKSTNSILSIFIVEYALGRLWMSWGVVPQSMTGHSLGEYAAACLAGVFSFDDALTIVKARGDIFDRLPAGGMLSVPLPEEALTPRLTGHLCLAALNAPGLSVVSGPVDEITALEATLKAEEIETRRLHISVAAHSAMLEPFLAEFAGRLRQVTLSPPAIPFISNVTGTWAEASDVTDRAYWVRHLRQTVRFSDGLKTILADPGRVLVEVGPGNILGSLARMHVKPGTPVIASMRHPQDTVSDLSVLYGAVGQVWMTGVSPDWAVFHHGETRLRVALPTYPFEHQRFWIEATPTARTVANGAASGRLADPASWLSAPTWVSTPADKASGFEPLSWLVFTGPSGLSHQITEELARRGHQVTTVRQGHTFGVVAAGQYSVGPHSVADYAHLIAALESEGRVPDRIAHLWLLDAPAEADLSAATDDAADSGFASLVLLAQALTNGTMPLPARLDVVTGGMQRVTTEPVGHPEHALILGPVRVIPRELGVACRSIDAPGMAAAAIADELEVASPDATVALRGTDRFVEVLAPLPPSAQPAASAIRTGGVYLITGGTGGIGRALAEHLARTHGARVVMVGRSTPPDADRFLTLLRALGGDGAFVAADVTRVDDMRRAVTVANTRFGRLAGVFHAAGTLDDGLVAEKDLDACRRVLAPKVQGTIAVARALAGCQVDFLVLFSSTSAHLGLPGQIDYTAANAFLNAYARSRDGADGMRVIAVGWGVWRDTGMAARSLGVERQAFATQRADAARTDAGRTPLLGGTDAGSDRVRFTTTYDPKQMWVLDEHRLKTGESVLPGTGYVEIAREAAAKIFGPRPCEIQDLEFIAPLVFAGDAPRAIRIEVAPRGRVRAFSLFSATTATTPPGGWTEHARGLILQARSKAGRQSVDAIRTVCQERSEDVGPDRDTRQERYLAFGPRWKNLLSVRYGTSDALAHLRLADRFRDDLDTFAAHPGLLDLATAAGLPLLADYEHTEGIFVPLGYGRIRIHAALTPEIYSHVQLLRDSSPDQPLFDVTISDPHGRVLIDVQDFAMRRLDPAALVATTGERTATSGGGSLAAAWIASGIDATEGFRLLDRLAGSASGAEVVASSLPLDSLFQQIAGLHGASQTGDGARRTLGDGDAPAGEVERELAHLWQDLLGVSTVGANDDFFELGGHSLIAVRLANRIEKRFGTKIKLATLFEARTVRQLAALLGGTQEASTYASLVAIQPGGRRPTLFVAHAVGGEVLSYFDLSRLLGPDQPLYGFRTVGHDGTQPLLQTIEEQAALYISEMRMHQPEGPYFLAGYSHGGRVVFEMALQLTRAGQRVAFVGILDTWPSEALPRGVPYVWRWLDNLPRWLRADFAVSGWDGNLDRAGRAARALARRLQRLLPGTTAPQGRQVTDDMNLSGLPDHMRLTFETNFKAFLEYLPGQYGGRVTLFRCFAQPLSGPHGRDLGWGRYAREVDVIDIPGNHGSMLQQPDVRDVARAVRDALARARAAAAT